MDCKDQGAGETAVRSVIKCAEVGISMCIWYVNDLTKRVNHFQLPCFGGSIIVV